MGMFADRISIPGSVEPDTDLNVALVSEAEGDEPAAAGPVSLKGDATSPAAAGEPDAAEAGGAEDAAEEGGDTEAEGGDEFGGDEGGGDDEFGGDEDGGESYGGATTTDRVEIPDKAKKRKLFDEYEQVCGTMDELDKSIEGMGRSEDLSGNDMKVLLTLRDNLSESKESLEVVMTQKFEYTDYNSLLMMLINFRTTVQLISRILLSLTEEDEEGKVTTPENVKPES